MEADMVGSGPSELFFGAWLRGREEGWKEGESGAKAAKVGPQHMSCSSSAPPSLPPCCVPSSCCCGLLLPLFLFLLVVVVVVASGALPGRTAVDEEWK
jgi:hypothetical protein